MRLYHRSRRGDEILASGFADGTGTYMTVHEYTGVWFSNVPLDVNEGASGDWLLTVDLDEELIAEFEWVEVGKPYREWLIPAALVNAAAATVVVERPTTGSRPRRDAGRTVIVTDG